jgi:hypothetical protein
MEHRGNGLPVHLVSFPGGGHLGIEFTDNTPDGEHPGSASSLSRAPPTQLTRCRPHSTHTLPMPTIAPAS